jgi:hypothetical protein
MQYGAKLKCTFLFIKTTYGCATCFTDNSLLLDKIFKSMELDTYSTVLGCSVQQWTFYPAIPMQTVLSIEFKCALYVRKFEIRMHA